MMHLRCQQTLYTTLPLAVSTTVIIVTRDVPLEWTFAVKLTTKKLESWGYPEALWILCEAAYTSLFTST